MNDHEKFFLLCQQLMFWFSKFKIRANVFIWAKRAEQELGCAGKNYWIAPLEVILCPDFVRCSVSLFLNSFEIIAIPTKDVFQWG